jgi:tetratricopeptide (TPR) repeat protein
MLQGGARALGLEPYEPIQQYAHTPYNELVHWHQWSGACFRFGRFEEALARNDRALRLAREQEGDGRGMLPATLSTRGSILKDLGKEAATRGDTTLAAMRDGQAEVAYQEALAAFPPATTEEGRRGRSLVWHQLGVFHNERGRWAEAEAAYVQALAIQPDKPNTYFNRANNLAQWAMHDAEAGQREVAIARLREARVHAVTALGMRYPPATRVIEAIEGLLGTLGAS